MSSVETAAAKAAIALLEEPQPLLFQPLLFAPLLPQRLLLPQEVGGVIGGCSEHQAVGDARKENTIKWANLRLAHKNNRGRNKRSKPTYAQVVVE